MNGHCATQEGRRYSLFAAFFRQARDRDPATKLVQYGHSVTWGIFDVDGAEAQYVSRVDPSAPKEGLKRIRR